MPEGQFMISKLNKIVYFILSGTKEATNVILRNENLPNSVEETIHIQGGPIKCDKDSAPCTFSNSNK